MTTPRTEPLLRPLPLLPRPRGATPAPARPGGALAPLLGQARPAVPLPAVPAAPVRQVVAPGTAASAAAVTALRVETQWLVTATPTGARKLHHAVLDRAGLLALADTGRLTGALACGAIGDPAVTPSLLDVALATRCTSCCTSVGYPFGAGSPDEDPTCAARLEERLAVLG